MTYYEKAMNHFNVPKKAAIVIELMKGVINTEEDYNNLIKSNPTGKNVFFTLYKIQKEKIDNLAITKNDFLEMFSNDPKSAIESLFVVGELDNYYVNEFLNRKLNPEILYNFSQTQKYNNWKQVLNFGDDYLIENYMGA